MRPPGPPETMAPSPARSEVGLASWYGTFHQGLVTASGEVFDMTRLTAAHRSLPLGARVRVTNMENGRVVRVRVNDRGPYVPGRIVDLSRQAAQVLGMIDRGVALVRLDLETTAGDTALLTKASPSQLRLGAPGGWT
jgi:peptidoglycan lytic transglycosylase